MVLFVCSVLWDLGIPQETATVLYEDNDACTAMGNAQKSTSHTQHMDITYFLLSEWVDRDLMHLECINTLINMVNHLTKAQNCTLFHHFLLGHIPPIYSLIYKSIVGTYTDQHVNLEHLVPESFTTPTCAAAARVYAPLPADYVDNPWLPIIVWYG